MGADRCGLGSGRGDRGIGRCRRGSAADAVGRRLRWMRRRSASVRRASVASARTGGRARSSPASSINRVATSDWTARRTAARGDRPGSGSRSSGRSSRRGPRRNRGSAVTGVEVDQPGGPLALEQPRDGEVGGDAGRGDRVEGRAGWPANVSAVPPANPKGVGGIRSRMRSGRANAPGRSPSARRSSASRWLIGWNDLEDQ